MERFNSTKRLQIYHSSQEDEEEDQMYSVFEQQKLEATATSLGINLTFDDGEYLQSITR